MEAALARRGRRKPSLPVILDKALAAVMSGGVPDVSGDDTLGVISVADPYEEQDWRDGRSTSRPVERPKVVRLDVLGKRYGRKQILEAQYRAGRLWQRFHEAAEISNLKAIDFTRDVVDGGKLADPMSDHRSRAIAALARYDRLLGHDGSALIRQVLGNNKTIEEVLMLWGIKDNAASREYLGRRFIECLDTLAEEMNLATKRKPRFPSRLDNPPSN